MDDSQSSDVFSDRDLPFSMDVDDKLELSFCEIKKALSENVKLKSTKAAFGVFFSNTLIESASCVNQKLELILIILEDPENLITRLTEALENIISLLQMLSSFLKNVLEAVTMTCASMETFPISIGQLLSVVFTHCKESESLYGAQLHLVEEQLKGLFKACHELQLVYLMILDKHFLFDLSVAIELDVLLKALDLNLHIGEIVEALDLKTMAEQWKAYTMLCERYSHYIIDKQTFHECSTCLCKMIKINLRNAFEQEDQKAIGRSLKVSNFAIKILVKLCLIFKHAVEKRFDHIVELLVEIQMCHPSILANSNKSPQFSQAMSTNVLTAADTLVSELLADDIFVQCILYHIKRINESDSYPGYILLLISVMKCLIQADDPIVFAKWTTSSGCNLFSSLFSALPRGHVAFNLEYKCNISANSYYCGLYEYLLIHTSLVSLLCSREQYETLECLMLEALLNTELYGAMFAADLWVSLASISPPQTTMNQLIYLSNIYKELENTPLFTKSPQKTYLSQIITRLFKTLPKEEKQRMYNTFDINSVSNKRLWTAMKIKNLPDSIQRNAEERIVDDLKTMISQFCSSEYVAVSYVLELIVQMKLAATCSFVVSENIIGEIVRAWQKSCPNTNPVLQFEELTHQNQWFLEYVDALQALTMVLLRYFQRNSQSLIKVLHVISELTSKCCTEIKLVLIKLVFKLYYCEVEKNKSTVDNILADILRNIFNVEHYVFKTKLYEVARQQEGNENFEDVLTKIIDENPSINEEWSNVKQYGRLKKNQTGDKKYQLKATEQMDFSHKCLSNCQSIQMKKENSVAFDSQRSNNFEFADVDALFDLGSDTEQPAVKKLKPEICQADELLNRIESSVTALSKIHVPTDYNTKILVLSERLRNIVK